MTPAQPTADVPPDPLKMWKLRSRALLMAAATDLDTHAMPWTEDLLREMARAIQAVLAMYLQVRWTQTKPAYEGAHVPEVRLEAVCVTQNVKDIAPICARVLGSRAVKERKLGKETFSWRVQGKLNGTSTKPSSVQSVDVAIKCFVRAPDDKVGSKDAVDKAIALCDKELNSRSALDGWERIICPREGYGIEPAQLDAERLWDLRVRFTLFLKRFCSAYDTNGILDPFTVFLLRPRTASTLVKAEQRWGTGLMGYRYALDQGQIEAALDRFGNDEHLQALFGEGRLDALFLGYGVGMCGEVFWKGRAITRPATLNELAMRYPAQEVGEHLKKFEQSILNDRVLLEVPVYYVGRLAGEEVVDGPSVVVTVAIKTEECGRQPGGQHSALSQSRPTLDRAEAGVIAEMAQRLMVRQVVGRSRLTADIIVGASDTISTVRRNAVKFAPKDSVVLITGETGTGKNVVASALHQYSGRPADVFVAINCAGLDHSLLESELFGHVRGAFTGAETDRAGVFEVASGGTLFLDEIGELPLATQAKLLRVLEDKVVVRKGSTAPIKTNFRLVVATNKDLVAMVKAGAFREDLYFRIRQLQIHVPPLRDRSEDIRSLVPYFLEKKCKDRAVPSISDAAWNKLLECKWPGNVRQLQYLLNSIIDQYDDEVIDESMLHDLEVAPGGVA